MIYPALSEEAVAATADAARAWSDVLDAWSLLVAAPPSENAAERWMALLRAGARAQSAAVLATTLAIGGARYRVTPFGVTGVFAAAPPPAQPTAPAASTETLATQAARVGLQSLARPLGRADDLTRIKGVGAKMKAKLNALGVFHFWQLASMSKVAVARLDEALDARGRVARDAWIAQARLLAEDVPA
jgi:predicted flap endonuclease-1-like 5' DNA nuclease